MQLQRLIVFTDADAAASRARGVVDTVARALADAAPDVLLVVRDKHASLVQLTALCRALLPVAHRAGARISVHTQAQLARDLDLDGVHLSSTADVSAARAVVGADKLVGASRHAGDACGGLDYATLSPIFAPTSKPYDARSTIGLVGLRAASAATTTPLFALGGVDRKNSGACLDAGAAGVAVLGAVMQARDPRDAVRTLRDVLAHAR